MTRCARFSARFALFLAHTAKPTAFSSTARFSTTRVAQFARFSTLAATPTRVVLTHSRTSYVDGLVPLLKRLDCSVASTATPGRISVTKGNVQKLTVTITVPVMGGFKAIAKRGSLAQEVFFTSALGDAALQRAIDALMTEKP
jgi:hypothetical protein